MQTADQPKLDRVSITGMDIVCSLTSDPARSIAFYRDVLGIAPTNTDTAGRGAEFTFPDNQTFGVWTGTPSGKTSGSAIMFAVADSNATVALLRERGLQFSDPMDSTVCLMSFGADPVGNGIIIHQRTHNHDAPAPTAGTGPITSIDAANVMVGDAAQALAFYRDMLDMTPSWEDEEGRGAEFELASGATLGIWNGSEMGATSGSCPMFAVDDAIATVVALRAKGAQLSPADDTGHCFMSFGKDPDGNSFAIHQLAK